MKSWRTTACGVVTLLIAALSLVAKPLLDMDPNTVPDWVAFGTAAAAALGLIFARDNKVTSEQAGAGK